MFTWLFHGLNWTFKDQWNQLQLLLHFYLCAFVLFMCAFQSKASPEQGDADIFFWATDSLHLRPSHISPHHISVQFNWLYFCMILDSPVAAICIVCLDFSLHFEACRLACSLVDRQVSTQLHTLLHTFKRIFKDSSCFMWHELWCNFSILGIKIFGAVHECIKTVKLSGGSFSIVFFMSLSYR